jgi:thiamine transport system substrate-binding protein
MKSWTKLLLLFIGGALLLSACAPAATATPDAEQPAAPAAEATSSAPVELHIMTHDSFAASTDVLEQFEKDNNVKLIFLPLGDAGSMLNQAILTKNNPQADLMYGIDNTFLSRGLEADIFEPYASPLLDQVDASFKLDSQNRVTPIDYGDVCINYDKAYFADHSLAVPQTLDDLLKPEYKDLLVTENPATSSPGLAFLLATIAQYGESGYLDYWQQLKANGLVVVNDWETAYYTNFSGSSGKGQQPLAVSYSSSPPVEVVYASEPLDDAPTASITGANTCFRQIEFAGILKGTQHAELAQKFIDFMLSQPFQEDMPLQMFVYPVNQAAALPEVFVKYSQSPAQPATLDPQTIADKRQVWVDAWTENILR